MSHVSPLYSNFLSAFTFSCCQAQHNTPACLQLGNAREAWLSRISTDLLKEFGEIKGRHSNPNAFRGLDPLHGEAFGAQKKFDSLSGGAFGYKKRNFDEIDHNGFGAFVKRNFDEIDRTGFGFKKRNFDEIDRTGFGAFVKRSSV